MKVISNMLIVFFVVSIGIILASTIVIMLSMLFEIFTGYDMIREFIQPTLRAWLSL